jgi:sortase A
MHKHHILKITGLTVVIFAGLLILANFGYFWQNFYYELAGTKSVKQPVGITVVQAKSQPNQLSIASLGITAPIVYAQEPNETSFQAALLNGVAHYPGTANPGQNGNCYIFGHSSDYFWSKGHYKTVFALLPRIKIGDNIIISDSDGNEYIYVVKSTLVAATTDVQYLQQDYSKKVLTLQTSWPVGTALKRYLVLAELK